MTSQSQQLWHPNFHKHNDFSRHFEALSSRTVHAKTETRCNFLIFSKVCVDSFIHLLFDGILMKHNTICHHVNEQARVFHENVDGTLRACSLRCHSNCHVRMDGNSNSRCLVHAVFVRLLHHH